MEFRRVTANPRQMGGVPCVRGLRIPVATVVALVAEGQAAQDILAAYPDLELQDIREALLFAAALLPRRSANGPCLLRPVNEVPDRQRAVAGTCRPLALKNSDGDLLRRGEIR